MADAADKVVADDERAMALLEEEQRRQRIAESMKIHDPDLPVDCFDCGMPVPAARLAAYPRTRRCTPCAALIEASYRRAVPG